MREKMEDFILTIRLFSHVMEHFTTGLNRLKEMGKLFTHVETFTNGICHWNEEIKQWLRECRERKTIQHSILVDGGKEKYEKYSVTYHETYEENYEVEANSPEEAEEILRERIRDGKEDGPEQCCDSWCDVTEL